MILPPVLSRPSAHSSMIRARYTKPAGRLRDRAGASSASRVSRLTSSGFKGRPRAMVSSPCRRMARTLWRPRLYINIFQGRNTRPVRSDHSRSGSHSVQQRRILFDSAQQGALVGDFGPESDSLWARCFSQLDWTRYRNIMTKVTDINTANRTGWCNR